MRSILALLSPLVAVAVTAQPVQVELAVDGALARAPQWHAMPPEDRVWYQGLGARIDLRLPARRGVRAGIAAFGDEVRYPVAYATCAPTCSPIPPASTPRSAEWRWRARRVGAGLTLQRRAGPSMHLGVGALAGAWSDRARHTPVGLPPTSSTASTRGFAGVEGAGMYQWRRLAVSVAGERGRESGIHGAPGTWYSRATLRLTVLARP